MIFMLLIVIIVINSVLINSRRFFRVIFRVIYDVYGFNGGDFHGVISKISREF